MTFPIAKLGQVCKRHLLGMWPLGMSFADQSSPGDGDCTRLVFGHHKVSLAQNPSFWPLKQTHSISFLGQKLC